MEYWIILVVVCIIIVYAYNWYVYNRNESIIKDIIAKQKHETSFKKKLRPLTIQIDNDINSIFNNHVNNKQIHELCMYSVDGGKRLRSIIGYSIIRKLNENIDTTAMQSANCVELLHTASLILDDIMDNDKERRGKATLHHKYGLANAQLCASYLVILSMKLPLSTTTKYQSTIINVVPTLLNDVTDLIDGQMMDLQHSRLTKKQDVLDTLIKKTASIFEMIFSMAWCLSNGDIDRLPEIRKIALNFGIAYQIYDDYTDYYADLNSGALNYIHKTSEETAFRDFKKHIAYVLEHMPKYGIDTPEINTIISYLVGVVEDIHVHVNKK